MEHILTWPYNKPTNNSRRPPRGAYDHADTWRNSGFPPPATLSGPAPVAGFQFSGSDP
ncbi:MAG: hypothetical protein ACMX3H_09360 [Sodalis sp. (in: enterobacteria)]|uniref:hypothetical protein n=1 Tax=Sodalis sp. (in: enterobacteria) TaxID=1898979 RepID=UPI0039E44F3D